jgi:hypothetical protein
VPSSQIGAELVPSLQIGAELLFEVFSQRYERAATIVTSNVPFGKWTSVFGSERSTGALLDRLTHHVHILEMNGDSYRLAQTKHRSRTPETGYPVRSHKRKPNKQHVHDSALRGKTTIARSALSPSSPAPTTGCYRGFGA